MAKTDTGKSKADKYREERKARIAKASKKSLSKSEKSLRTQKIVQKIIAIVLVAAFLGSIGWQIVDKSGVIETFSTALNIGSEKVSMRDYKYYYMLMYNNIKNQSAQYSEQYGYDVMGFDSTKSPSEQDCPYKNDAGETITWAEYIHNAAIDNAQQNTVLYSAALAVDAKNKTNKYTITDEEQKTIDKQIESIRTSAASSNMSINAYLRESYGTGVTEKFLRKQLKQETIVSRFQDDKNAEYKKACTSAVINKIYTADKDSYDVVSLRVFSFDISALTAKTGETSDALAARQKAANAAVKSKAEAMLASVTDEASFIKLAKANKTSAGTAYDADAETANYYKSKSTLESSISSDAATWAFGNGRATGDKKLFETDSAYFVVWVKTPQFPSTTVDVRHILLSFKEDTSDTTEATTEEIAAAKNKAEKIYAEWQKGKKTAASFAALAKKNSTDTGSADKGGLYEGVTTGQMVAPFENWCFDPARKPGDSGIVKSTYGYHIMYFVKANKTDYAYETTISEKKASDDYSAYQKALLAESKYKMTKNNKNISKAQGKALSLIDRVIEANKSNAASS